MTIYISHFAMGVISAHLFWIGIIIIIASINTIKKRNMRK